MLRKTSRVRRALFQVGVITAAAAMLSSQESLASFSQALLDSCALLRPPEKLNIAEWADKYGYLSAEGSARPGKFSLATAEYQREPLECLSPGSGYDTVVQMWSSQTGKTQNALWFAAYHVEHDPAPILFVEPDENLAKTVAKDRIEPMIRDTPVLRPLFGTAGGKRSGNDTLRKSFPGGQITFAWASSPTGLASRPVRILIMDEVGAYDAAPNKEGNPVQLAEARLSTYRRSGSAKELLVSSPRLERTCLITAAFKLSDQRHYYVPCPQCGHMQTLRFEQLKWPTANGIADTRAAYYVCEQNGCLIEQRDQPRMIRQGKWVAHNPGSRVAGFHLNALYSTIGFTWSQLVDAYLACNNLPERLQVFTNTLLGLPWNEQAERADLNEIQRNAEDYPAQAPAGVLFVTCGADVQKDRIESTKWGWGLNEQSWMIEHRIFHGDPLLPDVWRQFEAWRSEDVGSELGIRLNTVCTFVDSGDGNRQHAVLQYTKAHERLGVRACKGASQASAPIVSEARRVGRIRALQVLVGSSAAKDHLYGRFAIYDKTQPGAVHFPRHERSGASTQYFVHLTAEELVTRHTRSGEKSQWENPHKRNESLDTAVYALGAKEFLRPNFAAIARKRDAAVERAKQRGELLRISPPERAALVAAALQPSPSSASSPASPSPKISKRPHHFSRSLRLPGAAWVRG